MLLPYLLTYLAMGVATAIVTMRIFPPMARFRPHLGIRIFSALVFVALWPVLAFLAAWYFTIGYLESSQQSMSEPQDRVELTRESIQVPVSKPR